MPQDHHRRASKLIHRPSLVVGLRLFWIILVLWFEVFTFSWSVGGCGWPDGPLKFWNSPVRPTHVLVVADPQILDHRSYPDHHPFLTSISRVMVDLNLRKNWRAVMGLRPDAVVFLGDMMDGGRHAMGTGEYEDYFQRFKSIFKTHHSLPVYYLPGNHDIGLGDSSTFSAYAQDRFKTHFGPLNQRFSIANHTFVLLDTPTLVEEDRQRSDQDVALHQWSHPAEGTGQFVQHVPVHHSKPVILFSHIPLSRPDGSSCGPLRERGTIRRGQGHGYENTLSESMTNFLLERLKPTLVLSGDDHDYCEFTHSVTYPSDEKPSYIREVTVKSFSMAMGIKRPGYQLLSLAPVRPSSYGTDDYGDEPTHADTACTLPHQLGIYTAIYTPAVIISIVVIGLFSALRAQAGGQKEFRNRTSHRKSDELDVDGGSEGDESYTLPTVNSQGSMRVGPNGHPRSRGFRSADENLKGPLLQRLKLMFYNLLSRGRLGSRRNTGGMAQAVWEDVVDVAWPPLLLFLGISAWTLW
ncbi:hypothetical protein JAAARDRAFT_35462 [Jaapia argillacea MUCL 33604]|uniref:Calcineurin-like phosphoesterase domain-containing protein n=1 Tax=Jaapia argillacea MUCL 33604 TaxID=933084 RepID=A0A067PV85_9AGAM|nr:hypothetical protein JAAARDRAFT_35462 [Jaapia argillacea MUCL 33604]